MDADALKTFLLIHRRGGFSNAAEDLFRTQPAISRRIKLMEEELGAPLFERAPGGVTLTQAGRALLPYAERALAAIEDARTAVRELVSENAGPLSLAMVGTLAGTQLTSTLKRFAQSHPKVALTLRTATSSQVSDLVRRGEAVIGIRYHRDSMTDLDSRELGAERLVVVCSRNHRMADRSIDSLERLKNERWLAFPEDQPETSASHIFSIFLTQGIGEPNWSPIDSLTAQKRMVEAGFGLALLQESAIREELRSRTMSVVRVRHLNALIPIMAITRRGGFLSAAAKSLLALLARTYAAK
jgi:DNA-binding transcriptional LysR family regulator